MYSDSQFMGWRVKMSSATALLKHRILMLPQSKHRLSLTSADFKSHYNHLITLQDVHLMLNITCGFLKQNHILCVFTSINCSFLLLWQNSYSLRSSLPLRGARTDYSPMLVCPCTEFSSKVAQIFWVNFREVFSTLQDNKVLCSNNHGTKWQIQLNQGRIYFKQKTNCLRPW